jgi:hypothetical protein
MKHLILAAIAVLALGVGGAFAQSYSHAAPPATHSGDKSAENSLGN